MKFHKFNFYVNPVNKKTKLIFMKKAETVELQNISNFFITTKKITKINS